MTKILLVEDDKSLREIYGVRLLAEGYDIVSAGDGEEALAMAIKERPTLIISDVMMPKISGFDMLDILRSTTETKTIKVIMMTALSSEEQRLRGESLGADKYLVKSQVGIEDVVRVVHEVLDDQPTATGAANFTSTDYAAPQAPVAAPVAAPAPTPLAAAPVVPQPVAAPITVPQASPLPQPTTAYETPRPTGSGERIIQPLPSSQNPTTPPDMNALLDKELAAEANVSPVAPPPAAVPTYASVPTAPATDPTYEMSPDLRQQISPQVPVTPTPQTPETGVSSTTAPNVTTLPTPPAPTGQAPQA